MQCSNPINIVNQMTKEKLKVPCGKCLLCREAKTAEWTMRILAELNYSTNNYFITLTYNNANLPYNMNLIPQDLTKFFKRFRKKNLGKKNFKYFACGEYGDEGQRPHYHAILLNTNLDISKMYKWRDQKGKIMISSEEIDKVWGKGNTTIGGVERQSIQYVTGYVRKKLNGEKAKEIYGENNAPFARISKGIGKQWAIDNAENIAKTMRMIGDNGKTRTIPRTFIKWICDNAPEEVSEKIKSKDKEKAELQKYWKDFNRRIDEIEEAKKVMKYYKQEEPKEHFRINDYLILMGEKGKRKNALLKELEKQSLEKLIKGNL